MKCGNEKNESRRPTLGNRKSTAFTLIEMMVVLGMLGILMGAALSGIGQAKEQARVAKANAEVRELMSAWLSYEAAYDDWPSDVRGDGLEATEANLKELMGDNDDKKVYLNAQLSNGAFRDPWGTPYRFRVLDINSSESSTEESFGAAVTFPNRNRYVRW